MLLPVRCLVLVLLLACSFPNISHAASTSLSTIPSINAVTLGDLGTDGIQEVVVGTGYGSPTEVVALRQDGTRIGSFFPYTASFTGGASVVVCDLTGDGIHEIITGAGFSGGPHVRVFTNMGEPTGIQFFAYNEAFRGGVSVACADVTRDGMPDIITTPGPTGGPHVKIFSATGVLENEVFLSDFPQNTGLVITSVTDGTITVEPGAYTLNPLSAIITYGSTTASTPNVSIQSLLNPSYTLTTATVNNTDGTPFTVEATRTTALTDDTSEKYIRVDLSTQTLTTYEYGVPAFSFLVSTGVPGYPTPLGKTTVTAKLPVHDYSWYYGAGNPNNYSLPNVKWNLRFRNHYYIHSAYWHNNFGHVMSHGCVNVSIPDAEKIFAWADVGTPVEIVE